MPADTTTAVAAAIRSARVDAGFTQESFAQEVGMDRSHYGAIERGEHSITIDTLALIAAGLDTSAWKLLRRAQV
ncbi:MAG TPA: helix-turn-helix transcriptional regulator [Solirubrobacteraceae bacterium]|nr:helix-turn-helix transcriptional regulator [Solirubrobacteraceae bacterium]